MFWKPANQIQSQCPHMFPDKNIVRIYPIRLSVNPFPSCLYLLASIKPHFLSSILGSISLRKILTVTVG